MVLRAVLFAFVLLFPASFPETRAQNAGKPSPSCEPHGRMAYLCGPQKPEDLIAVPDTKFLIASGLNFSKNPGGLYLVDTEAKSWKRVFPRPEVTGEAAPGLACGAMPGAEISAHGLAIAKSADRKYALYVVNHGGREAVEFFSLDVAGGEPILSWTGCFLMPEKTFPNSVSVLPDGGLVVTSMTDPSDPRGMVVRTNEKSGAIYTWHRQTGVRKIPGSEMVGTNGIVVLPERGVMIVNEWGLRKIHRMPLPGTKGETNTIAVDFFPDNLRLSPNGTLLVTGQNGIPQLGCGARGCEGYVVARLDPGAMALETLHEGQDRPVFNHGTVAVEQNGHLWIGSFTSDAIAYVPLTQ